MKTLLCLLSPLFLSSLAAQEMAPTYLTLRGKQLRHEPLGSMPVLTTDKPKGFASGFSGWRFSVDPGVGRSGSWNFGGGAFNGVENPAHNHPATASLGVLYQDAVIQVEFRLNDVPLEGRKYRSIFVKATDEKDYVAALFVGPGGSNLTAYSVDKINPSTKQRDKEPAVGVRQSLTLGEWYVAVVEICGDVAVASVAGKSVTTSSPLFGKPKHTVMLGVGVDASFRNLRIWEATPNPEWLRHRETISKAAQAARK